MSTEERLALKTPENAFLHILDSEFEFSPRLAGQVLAVAQEVLVGDEPTAGVRPGQIRQVVARLEAPFGPPLAETDKVEVTLTVDSGADDQTVKEREGSEGLRQGRILRLVEEAVVQGGVMTQEDLARALSVDVRTIRRDVRQLKQEGQELATRGQVQGVGRGQTHKVRIIQLWLEREGYDQIARRLHHSPRAIQRYVSTFLRMVMLHQKGMAVGEIAFLTKSSERLVADYLAVYQAAQAVPHRQEKLAEEVARLQPGQAVGKAEAEKKKEPSS